jgi:hypothetical protein
MLGKWTYQKIRGKDLPKGYITWGTIVFLVVAFFMAWRDVRREADGLKQKLTEAYTALTAERASNTPNLVGALEQIVSGDSSELHGCQVFILMSVKNLGAPSVVEGWKIHIKSDAIDLNDIPTFIPDGFTLHSTGGNVVAKFNRNDAIYEKTIKPVERGGLVRGWLRFNLTGIPAERIRKAGTKISVSFEDVLKRQYTATRNITGEPSGKPTYMPGAEQPFKNFP